MASLADEDESQGGSSDNDNDQDETMEDVDQEEADTGADGRPMLGNDYDNDDNEDGDEGDDNDDAVDDSPTRQRPGNGLQCPIPRQANAPGGRASPPRDRVDNTTDERMRDVRTPEKLDTPPQPSPLTPGRPFMAKVRPDMVKAELYDIAPTIAAPHSTSINTITATPDMRWVFSGGGDGWIRKFNWVDTVNAKSMLTVAQRHPFVDSVTKAGVLMSYWENEEPSDVANEPKGPEEALPLSPVYSLAVHPQALWLLSGTEVGAINIQSVRHEEGKRITSLFKHTSAVSVMSLLQDNKTLLSGSWDKNVLEWDLNTGQVKRDFLGSRGQISAIEIRPSSSTPIPRDILDRPILNGSINTSAVSAKRAMSTSDGPRTGDRINKDDDDTAGSPSNSLFESNADNASLFGDDGAAPNSALNFEDDDEFSKAIASGIKQNQQLNGDADIEMGGASALSEPAQTTPTSAQPANEPSQAQTLRTTGEGPAAQSNGIPYSAKTPTSASFGFGSGPTNGFANPQDTPESTFLDAAFDGTIRIWDRRQPNPVAKIAPQKTVPPWCMHACWSPDGDSIYVGRRNGTVDEYNVHKGLRDPVRSLKFPGGSGPVSAVRAMPNSRHLVCASYDILRLYDLKDHEATKHANVPFLIVPGHRTGVVSQLYIDATCSFMISTGGNRGWEGTSTEVLLGYEIGIAR